MTEETRRLAAIMFTDMVGYTAITQTDEALALSLLRAQEGIILPLVRAHRGTPVKTIGDAHLAEFDSALEAVNCAVDIQRRMKARGDTVPPSERFAIRIGVHLGDVVHREDDVFGDAVNIASRLEPLADPGGVCISQQVYDQVNNKVGFRLEKLPFHQLKNVNSRIDAYKVIDMVPGAPHESIELPKERVAVLPLSNFSPSPQDEYLADGMTEELITAISRVQGLRVIARTSVMKFKNKETDVAEIGRVLNAGTVLEGSFRKIGERIRVTVQLIDAGTEEHRWASNYDGDMSDIFTIQTDIAGKVAQALQAKLVDQAPARPVVLEAYELYLKGRNYWNLRTREGVTRAMELFRAATEKDPSFAKAYAGVADCYSIGKGLKLFGGDEADRMAEAAVQKSLELDDNNAEAHASLGLLRNNQYRFTESQQSLKRALQLNPSYASAHHWYSICLANLGRLAEAMEEARLASQSDPLSPPARSILGVMCIYARDYDKALEVFNEVVRLEPGFTTALIWRSNAYAYKGMEAESMRDLTRGVESRPQYEMSNMLAYNNAWFGHKEEAAKFFEEMKSTAPSQAYIASQSAGFFACLGDADGFFKWVYEELAHKDIEPETIRYAPYLDKIRSDPRFADLLKSLPS